MCNIATIRWMQNSVVCLDFADARICLGCHLGKPMVKWESKDIDNFDQ